MAEYIVYRSKRDTKIFITGGGKSLAYFIYTGIAIRPIPLMWFCEEWAFNLLAGGE